MTLAQLRQGVGQKLGTSHWFTIDQAQIDRFADVTQDHQFIHTDPDRAKDTPFGGTIAHGFLTLSLLSAMAYDAQPQLEGAVMGVNYGFDRLRFVSPVHAGARVRAHFTLTDLAERKPGEIALTWDVTVEIEGQDKPAIAATWLNRRYLAAAVKKEKSL